MASTFFGLNIAYTGIQAANAKINTTANNISNVETKGYTRQEANQIAADALRIATTYGMAGSGVETTDITQVRNFFYDVKYWQGQTNLGQYEMKHQYMTQIEDYFATLTKDQIQGFEPVFTNMFKTLTDVYNNAGEDSKKTQFIGAAADLCKYFNAQSTNLEKLQLDVNAEIRNRAETINAIGEQIATLNKQINTIEINNNAHANELRDRRALLIDELSKIVDVEVRETPIYIYAGSEVKSGINNYEVLIGGGQCLVNGYDYNTLNCVAREYKVNQSDAEGLYDLSWSNGLDFSLYGGNLGGELKGLIEMRDGNNDEYFHGTTNVKNVIADPNTANVYKITVEIPSNAAYLTDMNKNKLPGDGKINFGNAIYDYTEWECDLTKNPPTYTFTIKAEPGQRKPTEYTDTVEVKIGNAVNYQGIAYYQSQLNEWTRLFTRAMNDLEKRAADNYGERAEVLFVNNDLADSSHVWKFDDAYDANGDPVSRTTYNSKMDEYFNLTAASFQVNRSMELDVNKFGVMTDIHTGADTQDQDIVAEMLKIQNDKMTIKSEEYDFVNKTMKTRYGFRGCTAQEFLQIITSDIALGKNNAMTFEENYTNISKSISNQRMSVSSVDNDEEALNLVKFKEAYNLSAKVMQIMTEIYDRLILQTGV